MFTNKSLRSVVGPNVQIILVFLMHLSPISNKGPGIFPGPITTLIQLALFESLNLCSQQRKNLQSIANNTIFSNFKHRSLRILVDENDGIGLAHTSFMLYRTGNTASEVNLRGYSLTGLTNLTGVRQEAFINCCTGTTHSTAHCVSQIQEQLKVVFLFHATTTGANKWSIINSHFAANGNSFLTKNRNSVFGHMFNSVINNFAGTAFLRFWSLESLRTASTHLRGMFLAQNGSHDVTTCSRTSPVYQTGFFNFQNGAICAKTGIFSSGNTRS